MFKRWLLPIVFLCSTSLFAQLTKVSGKITDASSGEVLAFVNVVFKGTNIGSNSDLKGKFNIEISRPTDSIVVSLVGYKTQKIKINRFKIQTVNVRLEPSTYTFKEVEIKPTENPAHIIMRKVIANKAQNNPDFLQTSQYRVYNKIQIDINDYPSNLQESFWFKGAEFIFNHADTTEDGRPFIPIFMTETASEIYTSTDPSRKQEFITGSRISGIENPSVSQFLGDLFQNVNVYDNYLPVFGKSFVSPLNDNFLRFYRYYLVDSVMIDSDRCYKLLLLPKRKQDLTFTGTLYIDDQTWGLKKAEVRFNEEANINFVKSFEVTQSFTKPDGVHWYLESEKTIADVAPLQNNDNVGFFARKTSMYSAIKINIPLKDSVFNPKENVIVTEDALNQNTTFWDRQRGENLTAQEKSIYTMIDSLQKVKRLINIKNLGKMLATGYLPWKKIDIGQYYTFFSWNPVEGKRIKIGGETSARLSNRFQLRSSVAYGTFDQRFKTRNQFLFYLKKKNKHRNLLTITANSDVQQLSLSATALQLDNILTSLLRRDTVVRFLTNVREFKVQFEYDWFQGFSNKIAVSNRFYEALGIFAFERNGADGITIVNGVGASEIQINTRFAWKEKNLNGAFRRSRVKSRFPVIQSDIILGQANMPWAKDISGLYIKTSFRITNSFNINPIGYTNYIVELGKYWGNVPYLFLEIHQGSQTYAFDKLSFNMMRLFEFTSDQYVYLFLDHHFEGYFFNKIPLIRKLKWREVLSMRSVMGSISNNNLALLNYPGGINPRIGNIPYIEGGFAIENIFKIVRIDALWRLTHQKSGVNPFGLRVSFQFNL